MKKVSDRAKIQLHEVMGAKVEFTKEDRKFVAEHKGVNITLARAMLGAEPAGTIIALGHFKQDDGGRLTIRGVGRTPAAALFQMSEVIRAFKAATR